MPFVSWEPASQGQDGERKVLGLGELVTEQEMCRLLRNIAEESCCVSLFVGKFCLSAPSPLPAVYLKNVCGKYGFLVSRRLEEKSGVISIDR